MSFSVVRISSCLGAALLTAAALHVTASPAAAQPAASRGRSPDGRAYRIENGMKLTDYIAELEVTNDDLHRQLDAAEQELADKDEKLQRNGKGVAERPASFEEHNLIPQSANNSRPALPPAAQPADAAVSCNAMVQGLNSKVLQLEDQLRKTPSTVTAAAPQPVLPAKCDYNSPENPYLARVKALEASLTQRASDNEVLQSEHNRRLASEQELAKVKTDLGEQSAHAITAAERANDAAERAAALEQELKETKLAAASKPAVEPVRAALAVAPAAQPARTQPDAEEKPAQAPADGETVVAARAEFKNDLQQIQSSIIERKNLLDSVKSKGKGITISIQPLVTKSGTSLDNLRLQVQKLDGSSEIGSIRRGLAEITSLLSDDVQTLKRMVH